FGIMGSYRSKEDDVSKISTSIFVSNFPDRFTARDLWYTCQKLVNNLCTIWIGRIKLQANVARFQRAPKNKQRPVDKEYGMHSDNVETEKNGEGIKSISKSFAQSVKGDQGQIVSHANIPTLVLDESCLNKDELSLRLLGKVKDFASLNNLKVVLAKEEYANIEIKYMGGFWVMIVFREEETMNSFRASIATGSWFTQIMQAHHDFTIEERVMWMEIEGVPWKWWSRNTFSRIASRWGTLLNGEELEDGNFHSNRLCICTKTKLVVLCICTKTKLVVTESFKMVHRGKVCWARAIEVPGLEPDFEEEGDDTSEDGLIDDEMPRGEESIHNDMDSEGSVEEVPETCFDDVITNQNGNDNFVGPNESHSDDPFGIYRILNKKNNRCTSVNKSDGSLKYPPGFTPNVEDGGSTIPANDVEENSRSNEPMDRTDVENQVNARSGIQNENQDSICSGHFKKSVAPRTGGLILHLIDELIKVGQTMGFDMSGCLAQSAKKDWVKKLCVLHKVNFVTLQETKMEKIDLWCVKKCWGNLAFDYAYSEAVGNSGGILCIWDPNSFIKLNETISDYFTIVRGKWVPNGMNMLIVSVYAPQDFKEKRMLWDYLHFVVNNWDGQMVIMGDFNEVRDKSERYGSVFYKKGVEVFNNFINNAGLVELPLGGCSYTWYHKSAKKMSKLDRFLIFENMLSACPNLYAVLLDRFLSDHRPILMREHHGDYGPTPFKFFHYWFEIEGFDKFVEESWIEIQVNDQNQYSKFMKKLKLLKEKIRVWIKIYKESTKSGKRTLNSELVQIDSKIDRGEGSDSDINRRHEVIRLIQDIEKVDTLEMAQKAKIKWAIEGDENSKYFHGVINKKRGRFTVRGVMANGTWLDSHNSVKMEFFEHFKNRFDKPGVCGIQLVSEFPNRLSTDQKEFLEGEVSNAEIKKAVWDCGIDKAPGPDGFTFGFYRRYWNLIEKDVVDAIRWFFEFGNIPKGGNSSFISLIPKIPNANMVKDFRPISLIGSVYKIIAKILANRLVMVVGDLVNEIQSAFVADRQILDGPFILNELVQWCKAKKKQTMVFKVDFEKAYDSVRWDFLNDVMKKFGFGEKWCNWIRKCLQTSRGSVLVNGSPTQEFQFYKGLKQGDPLLPFLFILVMESLHTSFQRVVEGGFFKGIKLNSSLYMSHLFYADDVIFMGQWNQDNIDTLIRVLD
ncbi:RNA-directed DNA polymerase, eukaryota, partial [Tanacetum coccineum]